jgi:mRNA interferase HicA
MPKHNRYVDNATLLFYSLLVTSQELKRWLQKQGCAFESGHGGHVIVRFGARISVLPMHGKQKELGTGLVNRIKKDLGLG